MAKVATLLLRPALFAAALLAPIAAMALTPSAQSNYGQVTLQAGFLPDPSTVQVQAGGTVDATTQGLPAGCTGFVSDQPDYKLFYTPGAYSLYIFATSSADTTLIINDPNGNWICNDDANGSLNPMLMFSNPSGGRYDIWVGTYSSGGLQPATLQISELGPGGGGGGGGGQPAMLNPSLTPNFGTQNLLAGTQQTVQLTAGGPISASVVGGNCSGFVTEAPDYRINFQNLAGILPLTFSVQSSADTTLVVHEPNGTWACDDDGGTSVNPAVQVSMPQAGQYDIWVGTYSQGVGNPSATLTITANLAGVGK